MFLDGSVKMEIVRLSPCEVLLPLIFSARFSNNPDFHSGGISCLCVQIHGKLVAVLKVVFFNNFICLVYTLPYNLGCLAGIAAHFFYYHSRCVLPFLEVGHTGFMYYFVPWDDKEDSELRLGCNMLLVSV